MRTVNQVKAAKANLSTQYMQLVSWTAKMLDAADLTAKTLGVSSEAIVAQAALESGWGKAAIGNNVFGIKADASWTGKTQIVTTREWDGTAYITIQAKFRDYDTIAECMQDHFNFLKTNNRYLNIFAQPVTDEQYFNLLQADGYATDPHYAASLKEMLDSVQDLEQYITTFSEA